MRALCVLQRQLGLFHCDFPPSIGLCCGVPFLLSLLFEGGSSRRCAVSSKVGVAAAAAFFGWTLPVCGRPLSDAAVGRRDCSRKGSSDPTGRRRTMPGFAIATATVLLWSVCLARP